jgi:hypothetical protein
MTDRERILMNIAAWLACELDNLQRLPAVQQYMANPHSLSHIVMESNGWLNDKKPFVKGELVMCQSSARVQQNPFIISFVEENGCPNDANGLVLRAIGTDDLCNYENESFVRIKGIPERFLWEGDKQRFNEKLHKALRKLDTYFHRFRGLEFIEDGKANVWFGEMFGGFDPAHPSKPYFIQLTYNKKTSIKNIIKQLEAGGFGKRKFEPADGKDEGPFGNPRPITRDTLIKGLGAAGIDLKVSEAR